MKYCPNCASEVKPELHYCSICGFRTDTAKEKNTSPVGHITTAVGFIGVVAVIGFIFLLKVMLEGGVTEPVLVAVSLIYFSAVFGICAYLLSYLKLFLSDSKPRGESNSFVPAVQIPAPETGKLEPGNPTPASVTEHTTRTLDKLPAKEQ